MVRGLSVSVAELRFVIVTVWTVLPVPTFADPNPDDLGVTETAVTSDPLSDMLCGLPEALSVMLMEADSVPEVFGVKVTLNVQLAPTATLEPQLLVWLKSLALDPVQAMLDMASGAVPVFVKVAVCTALGVR
jgi:hypothetical protein